MGRRVHAVVRRRATFSRNIAIMSRITMCILIYVYLDLDKIGKQC